MTVKQAHQHKQGLRGFYLGPLITAEGIVAAPREQLHGTFLGEVQLASNPFHLFCHHSLGIFDQFVTCLGIAFCAGGIEFDLCTRGAFAPGQAMDHAVQLLEVHIETAALEGLHRIGGPAAVAVMFAHKSFSLKAMTGGPPLGR